MSPTPRIIIAPITINAGAVAYAGIAIKTSEKKTPSKNKKPTTTAVNPVLPPSSIPEADSMYVVTVLVPMTAPIVVPAASAIKASSAFSSSSFSFTFPAILPTPYRVPAVSNISTKKNAITTIKNEPHPPYVEPSIGSPALPRAPKTAPTVSDGLSGVEKISEGASEPGTIIHPITLMAKIPIIIAPFCSLAINAPIAMSPIKAQNWPDS